MQYDYVIKNGTVVDCTAEYPTEEVKDIFIKDGKIAGESGSVEVHPDHVIDAQGKYVLPGLIDEHTHLNYLGNAMGSNADILCIPSGVTTAVDAGTAGWSNFEAFYQSNILRYTTTVKAYLHCSPYGMMGGVLHDENQDPDDFNETEILHVFQRHPDVMKGLKIRLSKGNLCAYGLSSLRRAVEIAGDIEREGYPCKVVAHVADLPEEITIPEILKILRRGDLFVHVFQPRGETIFTPEGKVRECVKQARKKGIVFDCSNGRPHWSVSTLRNAVSECFYPDIISSDVIRFSEFTKHGFSLLHAMCVCSAAGMDDKLILKAVTYNPAKILGILNSAGTLKEGTPADVCIMDIARTEQKFYDQYGGCLKSNHVFVPLLTMKSGRIAWRQIFYV